jgi:hypothetical protein
MGGAADCGGKANIGSRKLRRKSDPDMSGENERYVIPCVESDLALVRRRRYSSYAIGSMSHFVEWRQTRTAHPRRAL